MWLNQSWLGITGLQRNLISFQNTSSRAAEMQPGALGTQSTDALSFLQHHFEEPCGYNILSGSSWALKKLGATGLTLQWQGVIATPHPGLLTGFTYSVATVCVIYGDLTAGTGVNSAALLVKQPLRSTPLLFAHLGSKPFIFFRAPFQQEGQTVVSS